MKRKVLCFFSLILILLVFFTIVSPKVEDEMYTLVDARKARAKAIAISLSVRLQLFGRTQMIGSLTSLREMDGKADYGLLRFHLHILIAMRVMWNWAQGQSIGMYTQHPVNLFWAALLVL